MVKKKNSIPGRWKSLTAIGQRIPGSRFIAFKVPLKWQANQRVAPNQKFTPKDLLSEIRARNEDLGLIIDLTYTERYYTEKDLPRSVQYIKLCTAGQQIPEDGTIHQFKKIVRRFIWQNTSNDKLIGVHCTTGINRTGYLICRYLIDVDGWDPETAVNAFAQTRGHPLEGVVYTGDLLNGPTRSNLGIDQPPSVEETRGELKNQPEDRRPEKQSALRSTKPDFITDEYGDFDARKLPLPPPLPKERPRSTKLFEDDKDFLTTMPEYVERVRVARQTIERQKLEAIKISAVRERSIQDQSLVQPKQRIYNSVAEVTQEILRNRSMEAGRLVESQSRYGSEQRVEATLDRNQERFGNRTMDRIMPANSSQSLEFSQGMVGRHDNYSNAAPGPAPYSSHPMSLPNFNTEICKTDIGKTEAQSRFQYQHASEFSTKMAPLDRNDLLFGERPTPQLTSNIPTSLNELLQKEATMNHRQLLEMQSRSLQESPGLYLREREMTMGPLQGQRMDGMHPEEKQFLMNKARLMIDNERSAGTSNYEPRLYQERNIIPAADFRGANRFAPYQPPMRPQQSNDFLRNRDPGPPLHENRDHHGSLAYGYNYNMQRGGQPMDRFLLQDIEARNRLHLK
ncbi:uncharacterized protein dusp11.2.S [Xenopus laevis]|uniref:RNA/RNP complex-1-interacting phosphatase n=2 Tax=Xenopus laevis TaxID=8355 RepID=A0A974CBD3_XENLA|nr:uncharacterized protein dusp11.2.S [Xenopus laevis]OCT69967.1 hypothetical protein XELAEV_18036893mg [Xenopus laevis]